MHHVICLRAQEKTKILGQGANQQYIPLGVQPICEKNFGYEVALMFSVEGEIEGRPPTHLATPKKWPKAMNGLFNNWKPQLLTPAIGEMIRNWNNSAPEVEDGNERLKRRAKATAEEGTAAYKAYFASLTPEQKKFLIDSGEHTDCKQIATEADSRLSGDSEDEESGSQQPDSSEQEEVTA